MKTLALTALLGFVFAGKETSIKGQNSNPNQNGQQNRNHNAMPDDEGEDFDDVDEEDVEALQHSYYSSYDPLSKIARWIPDRATMDACDVDDDGHDEVEMLNCVVDNAAWWAEWYIPYYFGWVFWKFDADEDDVISSAEMDALYDELERREMVGALIKYDQNIPSDVAACDADTNGSITKAEVHDCWQANVYYWKQYYFSYYFDIIWAWFDDGDDILQEEEWDAILAEIARIDGWSHLFRIRRYLPDDGFDSCTDADTDNALSKTEVHDCWIANVPYWKEYSFEYHFSNVWAYFDADEDDVLDADEAEVILEAAASRVLMGN